MTPIERLAARTLPPDEREWILADLREESGNGPRRGPLWRSVQSLRIAGRFHGECYHDLDDRLRIVLLLVLALALLWGIPAATGGYFPGGQQYFTDPLGRSIMAFWGASHVTSAIAAGLLIGRLTMVPEHAALARWHVAMAGVIACVLLHGFVAGCLGAILIVASTWLGDLGRRSTPDAA